MKKLIGPSILCLLTVVGTATWMQAQPKDTLTPTDLVELERLLWINHQGFDFAYKDNGDLWLSSFTPDATLDSGSRLPITGQDNIRRFATRQANPNRQFRHWTSTFHATPNPEGAHLMAFFFTTSNNGPDGAMVLGTAGYYLSQAVRTKDGWKLKHHVVHLEGEVTAQPMPSWVAGPADERPGLRVLNK